MSPPKRHHGAKGDFAAPVARGGLRLLEVRAPPRRGASVPPRLPIRPRAEQAALRRHLQTRGENQLERSCLPNWLLSHNSRLNWFGFHSSASEHSTQIHRCTPL